MSSQNSLSNAEGGDNCHTCKVLETALKGLNLKSDFYNTARCIHNNKLDSTILQKKIHKVLKSKSLTKSADNLSRIPQELFKASRSDKMAPMSDRSSFSNEMLKTFAVIKDKIETVKNTSIRSNEDLSSECGMLPYVEEDAKYKNLTPFEIKLQKDLEAYKIAKREAFEKWLKKKQEEKKASNKKSNKRVIEMKISPEEREETFRRWCERKKQIEKDEKHRKQIEEQRREEEKIKALEGKEEKLKEWLKKKAQIQKEQKRKQREEEMKLERIKEMRKRESQEAYRKWLKQAKNKPLPVPLNKGELSMKGSLTKMYVNPEPWKATLHNASSSASNISD